MEIMLLNGSSLLEECSLLQVIHRIQNICAMLPRKITGDCAALIQLEAILVNLKSTQFLLLYLSWLAIHY